MAAQLMIFLFFTFVLLNSLATQPVPRLSSQNEWRALLGLRSSLGISAKDWHKKTNPCLNWTGIECKNGHIIRINLSGLRRSVRGKLNPGFNVHSLPSFSLLSSLNSSGFLLNGSIPEWLGDRLTNLEVLDLRSSSIYGSIPLSLGSLSRLKSLYLSNNSITGNMPATLAKLVSLSTLDVSQNSLTGQIPSEISSLGNLTKLDLSSNYFSGGIPLDFASLSALTMLNLSNNSLSSSIPPQLGNLLELVELDLGFNSLSGSLPLELGRLSSLRKMLIGNNELQGPLLNSLFKSLTQLEYLVVCRNSFDDELPDSLWSMSNLKYLDLSVNNLSGDFPRNHAAHFNVTGGVFNFSNNLFYGNLSSRFGEIGVIDVSWNYFSGSSPRNDSGLSILLSNNCFPSVLYQRSNDACVKFYAERSIYFRNESNSKPRDPPFGQQPTTSRKRLTYVMIGVFGGLGLIVIIIGVALLLRSCKTNHHRDPNVHNLEEGESEMPPPKVLIDLCSLGEAFTYEEMILATSNFSPENLLKQGHSGDLFRGRLECGTQVVVKKVDLCFIRRELFMSELELFSKAMHPRLVPLVGHCLDGESDKFFVYKYTPNGDLSNALYRSTNSQEGLQSLDWITRLKIAIGAAEVLSYLHHECSPPFVHRDIQASSILLDDKYEVRIGSLSEVCAQGASDHHNMVSRLLRTPQTSGRRSSGSSSTTCAYDVYCFGKVLLELVTGKLGISMPNDADAKQWLESNLHLINIYEKEMVIKIVDQSLIIDEDLLEEVWAVAVVAKSCLNPRASRRPSMRHVLKALENPFKVVREENFSSGRLRTASWTTAFFGSWNNSSSDSSNRSSQTNREIIGGLKQSDRVGSRGSGTIDHSSSHKRSSSDVFPEPVEIQDGVNTS